MQGIGGGANLNVVSEFAVMIGRPIVQITGSSMTQERTIMDLLHLTIGIGAISCIQFIDRLPKAMTSKIGEMMHSIRAAVKANEKGYKLDPTSRITDKFAPQTMAPGVVRFRLACSCSVPYLSGRPHAITTVHSSHFRPVTISLPPLELVVRMLLHSRAL